MTLKRIYDNWSQLRAASGTPGSRLRREWRAYLERRPLIAYWGDSWFSTPLYRNLCWNSFARIDGMSIRLGGPGFTAAQMLTPAACRNNAERFAARGFDLLCLSIGGNDCLGERLARVFAGRGRMDADAAFEAVVAHGVFERLRARYDTLLSAMATVGDDFRVVGHGYAPLSRHAIGKEGALTVGNLGLAAVVMGTVGPWLWPVMRPILGSKAEAERFAWRLMVDGFRDQVLVPTRAAWPQLFSYADFSGIGSVDDRGFWYDEIHPTEAGFGLLATGFNAMIRHALPVAKRGAVG
ncbi:hypothetical protein FZO89_10460 [Luteimonas viscosa]|uniref:GDSL-like Lipase/Acylhydrolase family protein n=1 Tax=Luteimonas viscosa TaxID=1132694 RepID=A0A5D4XPR7_9GAMM|nr:hypothetical protein [Luteimonas viscosa]TYT26646.1 hypothetical protein FZO89_10460 [Luteimonas viscosa]